MIDQLALDVAVDLVGLFLVRWEEEEEEEEEGVSFFFFGSRCAECPRPPLFSLPLPLSLSLLPLTLSPRSMNLTATSSPVALSRISLATPKLPEPMSLIFCFGFEEGERKKRQRIKSGRG